MGKILLINPSKWGRGITPIWIASHTSILRDITISRYLILLFQDD